MTWTTTPPSEPGPYYWKMYEMDTKVLAELSLFSGVGGGLLGSHLLGWNPIGYVEYDDYCQRVLRARIDDGYLPEAPIFGDIRAFNREGYAESYTGMVDIITAGFPCQPFSFAGKRKGAHDERNMWPETLTAICLVRPRYVLLENVPGLLAHEYISEIYRPLAEIGFNAKWRRLSASELGAPHRRDRWWLVAYADRERRQGQQKFGGECEVSSVVERNGPNEYVANSESQRCAEARQDCQRSEERATSGGDVSDTECVRRNEMEQSTITGTATEG